MPVILGRGFVKIQVVSVRKKKDQMQNLNYSCPSIVLAGCTDFRTAFLSLFALCGFGLEVTSVHVRARKSLSIACAEKERKKEAREEVAWDCKTTNTGAT